MACAYDHGAEEEEEGGRQQRAPSADHISQEASEGRTCGSAPDITKAVMTYHGHECMVRPILYLLQPHYALVPPIDPRESDIGR